MIHNMYILNRFMMEDRDAILTDLNKREKECADEIDGLTKKQKVGSITLLDNVPVTMRT